MAATSHSFFSRSRVFVSAAVVGLLATVFLVADNRSAGAEEERATPVVGSFAVGGSVTAGVDEQSGKFAVQVPVGGLPGVNGSGAVGVGLSYSQDAAAAAGDPDGVGVGWGWGVPRVIVDGGVRVVTPSGQVYSAGKQPDGIGGEDSEAVATGLEGYVQGDLVFSQTANTFLSPRGGVGESLAYEFSLEHLGGVTDYFGADGRILARIDAFEYRSDWEWDGDKLVGVTDAAGSEIVLNWSDEGVEVVSPPRSDGVVASTVLGIAGSRLVSITDPVGEKVEFEYDTSGLLDRVIAGSGARTEITYQPLPNNHLLNGAMTVDEVRVVDSSTGEVLSKRAWKVKGDHNSQGSPTYSSAGEMWASGDGSYRHVTVLADGDTSVESVYNSMGVMLSRTVTVSTPDGEYTAQEQDFIYTGTEQGGVPDKHQVPEQYAKPTSTTVTYRDDEGGNRAVAEMTEFDTTGRVIEHVAADGSVTTTTYDTHKPNGEKPMGEKQSGRKLPYGLAVKQTTKGQDGTVSETTNTLTPDRKSVQATETRVAVPGGELETASRTEFVVQTDGFVTEQKIIAVGVVAEGPQSVVTRFGRVVDADAKTITMSQTDAAGTEAESTTSTVTDLVTGLELSATDPTGRVATSTYDDAGRVLTQTAPGNLRTVTTYERNITSVTDPTGVTQSERVDVLGRVVEITDNITATGDGTFVAEPGAERTIEARKYEHNGSRITVKDARGRETVTVSDVFGRPVSVTGPYGVTRLTVYDDVANTVATGRLSSTNGNLGDAQQVMTTRRDNSNRDIHTIGVREDNVDVPERATGYDGLGRVTAETAGDLSARVALNPDGTSKTVTRTPTKPDVFPGETVAADREHDMFGVSTKKTLSRMGDAREGVTRVLDAAGRTVSQTDQADQTTAYKYTVDGLVSVSHNTGSGVTTRNTYDAITRAMTSTETVSADGTTSHTAFEYDPVTGATVAVFDPTDRTGTQIRYTYDVFGNTTEIAYPDGKTIRHIFDEYGRTVTSVDIEGNITRFEYDKVGFLTTVTQTNAAGETLGRVGYRYDEFGRTTGLIRDNGVTTSYTFTSADQILTETTTRGTATILDAAYTYDSHGNLTQRVTTRPDNTDTGTPETETTVYRYDAYDQLTESRIYTGSTPATAPTQTTAYEIGVSGNVTKETITTSETGTTVREFDYNTLGQTTSITTGTNNTARTTDTQTYDDAGNLTQATDRTQYTYNARNQPVTETRTDGTITAHTYWATGDRRTTTTTSSGTTNTVGMYWDGATLTNDTHTPNMNTSEPVTTASYLIGQTRHTRTLDATPETTKHYVTDRHGNTTATTNMSGTVTTAYEYSDYGVTTTHTSTSAATSGAHYNPIQYAGEYTTPHGDQYLGQRTYNPQTTAFNTKDTADQFNLYSYANSNPITLIDPTGRTAYDDVVKTGLLATLGVGLAIMGLAASVVTAGASTFLVDIGITLAGLFDVGVATAQAANTILDAKGKKFMEDNVSEGLGWAAFGAGFFAGIAGALDTWNLSRTSNVVTSRTPLRRGSTIRSTAKETFSSARSEDSSVTVTSASNSSSHSADSAEEIIFSKNPTKVSHYYRQRGGQEYVNHDAVTHAADKAARKATSAKKHAEKVHETANFVGLLAEENPTLGYNFGEALNHASLAIESAVSARRNANLAAAAAAKLVSGQSNSTRLSVESLINHTYLAIWNKREAAGYAGIVGNLALGKRTLVSAEGASF